MNSEDKVIVFVGPTLEPEEVFSICPTALVCGPIKMGDLSMLLKIAPGKTLILDGYYETTPSVWHKEILRAIDYGWRVFGAASMGALRAAELSELGMVGLGQIFRNYKNGIFQDDDDVAVLHQPRQSRFRAVTEAQVNVFFTLHDWLARGIIGETSFEITLGISKSIPYKQRTWECILRQLLVLHDNNTDDVLDAIRREAKINQKKLDAIEAVKYVGASHFDDEQSLGLPAHSHIWLRELGSRVISRPLLLHEKLSDHADKGGAFLRFDSELFIACGELAKLMALSSALNAQMCSRNSGFRGHDGCADRSRQFTLIFQILTNSYRDPSVSSTRSREHLIPLAAHAAELWSPLEIKYKDLGIRPDEESLRDYAEEILETFSITSETCLSAWCQEFGWSPSQFPSIVEFLYVYREVVTYWNIHYLGVQDVELSRNWWREAFLLLQDLTGVQPTRDWARKKYLERWKTELAEVTYIRLGFTGGCEDFHRAVDSLDWGAS